MKTRGGKRLAAQCTSFVSKTLHILIVLFAVASDSFLDTESITAQTQPLQKVRIAYASSGINYADIFLAKEMGFYREEGLEPQFIQMNSGIAITAGISGELDGQASIGSAIRALQRGAPLRVVAVTLRRPLYWLVVRPEYRSVKDLKSKVLGISTIGGSQYNRAKAMLAMGGLDPDKDITSIQINDQTMQLQALVSNAVQ
jgi:NitT/TauT family transport system substrate-binding protein